VGELLGREGLYSALLSTWRKQRNESDRPKPRQPRALGGEERQAVLDLLHSPRFVDKPPAAVHAALLDEGKYHCHEWHCHVSNDAMGAEPTLTRAGGLKYFAGKRRLLLN